MTQPPWLADIRLITFNILGTIADWRTYVEGYFPRLFANFNESISALQSKSVPGQSFRQLATEAALAIGADAHTAQRFASQIGATPLYPDSNALALLKNSCLVGFVSNCDADHLLQFGRQIPISIDLIVDRETMKGFKPESAAWDRAIAFSRGAMQVKPSEWLHVSTHTERDLIPAKQYGLKTCFVPRPGSPSADNAVAASIAGVDLFVSDLNQLWLTLDSAKNHAVVYRVHAHCSNDGIASRFRRWLVDEHLNDLLSVAGCIDARLLEVEPLRFQCEYVFSSRSKLERYLNHEAHAMRSKGRTLFSESEVQFQRDQASILAHFINRHRNDF